VGASHGVVSVSVPSVRPTLCHLQNALILAGCRMSPDGQAAIPLRGTAGPLLYLGSFTIVAIPNACSNNSPHRDARRFAEIAMTTPSPSSITDDGSGTVFTNRMLPFG